MRSFFATIIKKNSILDIILKVVGSSIFLTLFNYSINLYGLSVLDEKVLGIIIFFQSFLIIGLQIGISGFNYEVLRFGNFDKYLAGAFGVEKRSFIQLIILSFLYVAGSYFFVNTIDGIFPVGILFLCVVTSVLILLISSLLRSLGEYLISNIIDKTIVTSTSVIIMLSSFVTLGINYLLIAYLAVFLIVLFAALLIVRHKIPLKSLIVDRNKNIDKNIRYNLYFGSIFILVVFEVQNIFIAEKASFEQLSLWNAYLLLFFPFRFIARNVHQILFPELANTRFSFSKKSITKYVLFILALSVFVFMMGSFPYKTYYQDKYDITYLGVFLVVIMGLMHMLFSPIGVYLGAKCSSRTLLINNIFSAFFAILTLTFYFFFIPVSFPYLLIIVLSLYWLLKLITGLILIKVESN